MHYPLLLPIAGHGEVTSDRDIRPLWFLRYVSKTLRRLYLVQPWVTVWLWWHGLLRTWGAEECVCVCVCLCVSACLFVRVCANPKSAPLTALVTASPDTCQWDMTQKDTELSTHDSWPSFKLSCVYLSGQHLKGSNPYCSLTSNILEQDAIAPSCSFAKWLK